MATFSFDIISDYDKAEVINVFQQVTREIGNRYDLRGTPAAIDWLADKSGYQVTAANEMHLQSILDIIRRALTSRGQSSTILDFGQPPEQGNLRYVQRLPFVAGLDQERARAVSSLIRSTVSRVKPTIQGDTVRVTSSSKDDLQRVMQLVQSHGFDFPLRFINYR